MEFQFHPRGVCSQLAQFTIDEDGKLRDVYFAGGCNGNLKGIGRLVEGMDAAEAARRLKGITCGAKSTSCPDQLAQALDGALALIAEQREAPLSGANDAEGRPGA